MSVSRGDLMGWRWVAVLSIAAGLAFSALPVSQSYAQTAPAEGDEATSVSGDQNAPIQLVPVQPIQPDQPVGSGTAPETPAIQGQGSTVEGTPKQGIEVQGLSEVSPESIGTLTADNGGFGPDLWAGSDRSAIVVLLQRLPPDIESATLRHLLRRLLLTRATPPRVGSVDQESQPSDLLGLRVERLSELGEVAALNELVEIVPQRGRSESVSRARVEGLFLARDGAAACQEVRNGIADYPDAPYWLQALIACQLAEGQQEQAQLGLTLLREQGLEPDSAYLALVDAFYGADVRLPQDTRLTPLHLFMLNASGLAVPSGAAQSAAPGLDAVFAEMPALESGVRIVAAERSVTRGLLDPTVLSLAYGAHAFEPEMVDNAISVANEIGGPEGRALLYQAAVRQNLPVARAEILSVALKRAQDDGVYGAMALALTPLLVSLEPSRELDWFAPTAGRALFAIGRYEQAAAWFAVARQAIARDPEARTGALALWPYAMLIGDPSASRFASLADWGTARSQADPDGDTADLELLVMSLFEALGLEAAAHWPNLLVQAEGDSSGEQGDAPEAQRPAPETPIVLGLRQGALAGRQGESLLLAAIALGDQGLDGSHQITLWAAIQALRDLGLDDEARALAIETAISAGI